MLIDTEKEALGKKLIGAGLIEPAELTQAMTQADRLGVSFERFLIRQGIVSKPKIYEIMSQLYGVPFVDVSNFQISPDALRAVPPDLATRYRAVPLFKIGNSLNIAMENPVNSAAIDHISRKSGCEIDVCLGAADDIETAIKQYYGSASSVNELIESLTKERINRPNKGEPSSGVRQAAQPRQGQTRGVSDHPVVKLVDLIIRQACEERASDIHIEPEENMLRIRYRVDGVLHEASAPSKQLESEIITRIKILAEMDIAENRLPQDGRMKLNISGADVDMRVSTMPTVYGENVVIRILKDNQEVLDLEGLGMNAVMRKTFEELIRKPYGMILETGPTGSGKTTTLYAALSIINSVESNIVTIEDPVEYKVPMIRQIPVNIKAGLTFANALRSILRQDPDVIMVGEIRDRETAEIAVQSALTGHLVFSTLHANTAAGVVTRLVDMKIEPFLIASSVMGVISQRLVRRICQKCKKEDKPSAFFLKAAGINDSKEIKVFKGAGCRHCQNTGYKGRVGIFELLKIDEDIQKKIIANASASELEREARRLGYMGLREDALEKIKEGLTTVEEVMKSVDLGAV